MLLSFIACKSQKESHQLSKENTDTEDIAMDEPVLNVFDSNKTEMPKQPCEGKIAIISNSDAGGSQEYYAAELAIEKYGEDKVIHVTWPTLFVGSEEQIAYIAAELGVNRDIKAIIIDQALPGTNVAVDRLKEVRKDIFFVCILPQESLVDMAQRANIIIGIDELGMGPAMVQQAQKLGAKTFVHYSTANLTNLLSARRDLIKEECQKLEIKYIDAATPDARGDFAVSQQFIADNVPLLVEKHGKDTAFFNTQCMLQISLIKAVVDAGAIYPQPCCPHFFSRSNLAYFLKLETTIDGNILPIKDAIAGGKSILTEKNMLGRISTWPEIFTVVATYASVEYAFKWINGEAPKEGIDVEALKQIMEKYTGAEVYLTPFVDDGIQDSHGLDEPTGEICDNILLMRMDYITFE
jgi:hypothetical protein